MYNGRLTPNTLTAQTLYCFFFILEFYLGTYK